MTEMPRTFLFYWKREPIDAALACGILEHSASDQFRAIQNGDLIWICGPGKNRKTKLVTVGPLRVDEIVGQREAERRL
jgi:hypothetical protein